MESRFWGVMQYYKEFEVNMMQLTNDVSLAHGVNKVLW